MKRKPKAATGERTPARVIRKLYMSQSQAERAQNKLYGQYDSVKLVEFPRFQQSGYYAWEVK